MPGNSGSASPSLSRWSLSHDLWIPVITFAGFLVLLLKIGGYFNP